jgi:hypothetical protein
VAVQESLNAEEKVDEFSDARDAGEERAVAETKIESRALADNAAFHSHHPLRITLGEDGPFVDVPKGGPLSLTRRLHIEDRNVDESKAISGGKVQITEILPFSGYRRPWILADNISLAAGDQRYLPIAQYGEARDREKSADTMIEVCCVGKRPLRDRKHAHGSCHGLRRPVCRNQVRDFC